MGAYQCCTIRFHRSRGTGCELRGAASRRSHPPSSTQTHSLDAHKQREGSTLDTGKVAAGRLTIAGCKLWQCEFVE